MREPITSLTNPRIKHLVKLRNRRVRNESGTFLVEGFRELTRAVVAGVSLRELYFCPDLFLGDNEEPLIKRAVDAGAQAIQVGAEAFHKASYRDRPEGLLGLADQFPTGLEALELSHRPLVLVIESIEKPGNLGTMLRTADAAGADAVIVCDPTTDPFNPNVVRASLGCLFVVPLAIAATSATLVWLGDRNIRTFATSPGAARLLWQADLSGPSAVAVGSEQYGLSEKWLKGADEQISIPMGGAIDSLNAAMAAGVVLYEAVRQRGASAN